VCSARPGHHGKLNSPLDDTTQNENDAIKSVLVVALPTNQPISSSLHDTWPYFLAFVPDFNAFVDFFHTDFESMLITSIN
jgi:hypothetical protein